MSKKLCYNDNVGIRKIKVMTDNMKLQDHGNQKNLESLPLAESAFSALRHHNMVYVDKTKFIGKLASTRYKYFLSRPRSFGKTLLLSTFESLFKNGLRDFNGLAIEKE